MLPNKNKKAKPKFKDWFSKYFKIVTILSVAIILAAAYFFFLGPLYKQIKANGQATLDGKQQYLRSLEEYLADLKKLKSNFDNLSGSERDNLEHLNLILPSESDLPGLFVQLDKLAANNGLFLASINISEQPMGGPVDQSAAANASNSQFKKLNIDIALMNGNYDDLLGFLDDVEYNLRLMDVTAIAFAGSDQSAFSVNLTTYYLAE